jgi:hypothetical protein
LASSTSDSQINLDSLQNIFTKMKLWCGLNKY